MTKNVKKYVNTCDICQKIKVFKHHPYGEMQVLSQSKDLLQKIIMDFIKEFLFNKNDFVYFNHQKNYCSWLKKNNILNNAFDI